MATPEEGVRYIHLDKVSGTSVRVCRVYQGIWIILKDSKPELDGEACLAVHEFCTSVDCHRQYSHDHNGIGQPPQQHGILNEAARGMPTMGGSIRSLLGDPQTLTHPPESLGPEWDLYEDKKPLTKVDAGPDEDEVMYDNLVLGIPSSASPELVQIMTVELPAWYELFLEKNAGYQNDRGSVWELGIPGQYSDMHRKFMKLKKAMWEGEELSGGEPLEEILRDLIGHCFLTLAMMEETDDAEA